MKRTIWMPAIILLLISLACSAFGAAERAVEVGQEAATMASEAATEVGESSLGAPEGEAGEELAEATASADGDESAEPEVEPDALSGLASYRVRIRTEWVPVEGSAERTEFEQTHTRDPRAQRLLVEADDGEAFEIVQVEDQSWYCAGGTCTQAQVEPEVLAVDFGDAIMFDPGQVTDESNAQFAGQEEINGIRARHYTLDLTRLQAALLAQGEVTDVQGEAWIADEPSLPSFTVRFEMSWKETRDEQAGAASFFYEVYDVNAPITIEPPAGAESIGLPEDVPPYPDAEIGFSTQGVTRFTSADDAAAIADFYAEALAQQGWAMESEQESGETFNQMWRKDERELVLTISSEDGETSFTIVLQ